MTKNVSAFNQSGVSIKWTIMDRFDTSSLSEWVFRSIAWRYGGQTPFWLIEYSLVPLFPLAYLNSTYEMCALLFVSLYAPIPYSIRISARCCDWILNTANCVVAISEIFIDIRLAHYQTMCTPPPPPPPLLPLPCQYLALELYHSLISPWHIH